MANVWIASPAGAGVEDPPNILFLSEMADPNQPVDHLILIYDELLDPTSIPDKTDFTVEINHTPSAITGVELIYEGFASDQFVSAAGLSFVKLSLLTPVTTADTVTIRYRRAAHAFRDLALNEAADFGPMDTSVTDVNGFAPGDMAFVFATVDGPHGANRIWLFFNRPIDPDSIPAPTDFEVKVNNSPLTPSVSLFRTDINIGMLDLILPVTLVQSDVVTIKYTPGTNPIRSRSSGLSADPIPTTTLTLLLPANSAAGTVGAGGEVSTFVTSQPTPEDPVASQVITPSAGAISITETTNTDPEPPGYTFFGQQVLITAPSATDPNNPLKIDFALDASIIPAGQTAASVEILRNGVLVKDCDVVGVATPSPCVSQRDTGSEGDLIFRVLTLDASRWNFAMRPPYALSGFKTPVDNEPTVNKAKAGSAIPVKFSLGGDRGLDVFETGSPVSQGMTCNDQAPIDAIEQTVSAGNSSLTYAAGTDTYTYVWKTNSAWAGTCRRLSITFAEGSHAEALFDFRR